MFLFLINICTLVRLSVSSVDDWEAIGCYNNFDHAALPVHFYTPTDLDVNELWPNLKPLVEACSKQAERRNYSCFGIQYQHECWGGTNASLTYDTSGKSRNCRVGIDNYGVGKLYTSFVYKLKPVNGNWSPWSSWGSCSKTCDEGFQKRTRECSDPAPANGGKVCMGEAIETKKCLLKLCPVNGQWGSWQAWSTCSVSCRGGVQRRKRSCNNPSPAHGGTDCIGVSMVTRSCNLTPCPVHGGWSPWNNWSRCQRTCGGGTQLRYRTCTHPPPQHSGKPCVGQGSMSRSCNTYSCPRGRRLVLCENNMAKVIKCGLFRRIRVHWVHYGYIEGDRACGTTYKNTCSSQKAVRVLKRWCEGKFFCLVRPWNKFFQAPCGNRKYLKVYFSC